MLRGGGTDIYWGGGGGGGGVGGQTLHAVVEHDSLHGKDRIDVFRGFEVIV